MSSRYKRRRKRIDSALRNIEAVWPERALDSASLRETRAYATRRLGSAVYAPWLELFATWRGEFVEGWIPQNYLVRYVVPYSSARNMYDIPVTLTRRILGPESLPDVGYVIQGVLTDDQFGPIASDLFAKTIFDAYPYVYVKSAECNGGRGVSRVSPEDFLEAIQAEQNAVIQSPLPIHPTLAAASPDAAPTLRITTVADKGIVRSIAAHLRLGRTGQTHIETTTSIRVAVQDMSDGQLASTGAIGDWTPITRHPDTGAVFSDMVIPYFRDAVEAAEQWHTRMPHVRYVGWDIAVGPDGSLKLFEANTGHTDTKFVQAAIGPVFAGLEWDQLHLRR